jgi:hypothetical protein
LPAEEKRNWLDGVIADSSIDFILSTPKSPCAPAGWPLPSQYFRHRLHNTLLVDTAQVHGHRILAKLMLPSALGP